MLLLFETPAGYALFRLLDDSKLESVSAVEACFANEKKAKKLYFSIKISLFFLILCLWKGFFGGFPEVQGHFRRFEVHFEARQREIA